MWRLIAALAPDTPRTRCLTFAARDNKRPRTRGPQAGAVRWSVQMPDQVNAAAQHQNGRDGPQNDDWHFILLDELRVQSELQTLTVFMPASASVRLL